MDTAKPAPAPEPKPAPRYPTAGERHGHETTRIIRRTPATSR